MSPDLSPAAIAFRQERDRSERTQRPTAPADSPPNNIADFVAAAAAKPARKKKPAPVEREGVKLTDFHALMTTHSYIFEPTGDMWPAVSVNARIPPQAAGAGEAPLSASEWIDRNRPVEQLTWAPGEPKVIRDRLIADGGWIERNGVACFNLYRPAASVPGDASKAGPWIDHVRRLYPEGAERIIARLAHRVQRPGEKINHALFLGGAPGIGKDTIIDPVKRAIGPWNCQEASPKNILGRFNSFAKSVILRLNEAHDRGEVDRYQLYEAMKVYCAAPPDVLRVDEKNIREYCVPNVCFTIITSNHRSDGIYLPPDDRRTLVEWSEVPEQDFPNRCELWGFYEDGGYGHVAAYLREYDLSGFDPKAPPPKTQAFWEIVNAGRAPENAELASVLDRLDNPDAVTLDMICDHADAGFGIWLRDRKNNRAIPHRFEECDYTPVRNPDATDGLWRITGKRQAAYAKNALSFHHRLDAACALAGRGSYR